MNRARVLPRMLGYVITLGIHLGNLMYMESRCKDLEKLKNPDLTRFGNNKNRYFTCWTVMTQIIYAILGFSCDLLLILDLFYLPRWLTYCRNTMFAAIVWPYSMVVCTFFWSVFLYDRSLIFPVYLDEVISPVSNHIIHSFIIPVVVWELACRRRLWPRFMAHISNIKQMFFHVTIYLCVFYYTYFEQGIWLYPIFKVTLGTINFVILHLVLAAMFISFYILQWPIGSLFHRQLILKGSAKKVK